MATAEPIAAVAVTMQKMSFADTFPLVQTESLARCDYA